MSATAEVSDTAADQKVSSPMRRRKNGAAMLTKMYATM